MSKAVPKESKNRKAPKKLGFLFLLLGLGFTPIALGLAFISAGAGHGDYVLAKLLFPISMTLLIIGQSDLSVSLSIALATVQYGAYGFLLDWTIYRRTWLLLSVAALLHVAALFHCFGVP